MLHALACQPERRKMDEKCYIQDGDSDDNCKVVPVLN
jgi:hypothetical protein